MTTLTRSGTIAAALGTPIRAVLATSTKQSDGYALTMSGAKLARFRANPVLMVVHDRQKLPVGKVVDLKVESARLTGELVFASDAEGQLLEQRVRDGIINAVSIGFDVDRNSVDRDGNVRSWEMLECSLVGVPMDAEALVYSRALRQPGRQRVDARAALNLLDAFKLPETPEQQLERVIRTTLIDLAKRGTRR